jgi:murein tripeptide amidase MpaA
MSSSSASTVASLGGNERANPQSSGYYGSYYSLTFEVKLKHDLDTVYFSHCYPYTYSDLCDLIQRVCTYHNKDKIRRTVLCKSLAGNDVEMLIVTNFASSPEAISHRKAIILTCRIHPGETNSSFIMNGVIEYLISDDEKADLLRNTFVFKIIPMLNPDGVIVGNYRCCLIGQDLNRQWIGPSSKQYPVLYHTKLMMKKTLESRDIFFFCDFHGHSTKKNIFMYGNNQTKPSDKLKERVFP